MSEVTAEEPRSGGGFFSPGVAGAARALPTRGRLVVGENADGRLQLFIRGTDGAIHHQWQGNAGGFGWSGWRPLGTETGWRGDPAVTRDRDGRLVIAACKGPGADEGSLWFARQNVSNGSSGWTGWTRLGGTIAAPAIAPNADGHLEIFGFSTASGVPPGTSIVHWFESQSAPSGFNGPVSLPALAAPAQGALVAYGASNRFVLLVAGSASLVRLYQTQPNDGWQQAWTSMGGSWASQPPTWHKNADTRLEVFLLGADSQIWHAWEQSFAVTGSGARREAERILNQPIPSWSQITPLGGSAVSGPVVTMNRDGRLEVFVRTPDDSVRHVWQNAPNSGWSSWAPLGGSCAGRPVVAQNADGRLEIFVRRAGTNGLEHNWQKTAGAGWEYENTLTWASFELDSPDDPTVVVDALGLIEVFSSVPGVGFVHRVQRVSGGWPTWLPLGDPG